MIGETSKVISILSDQSQSVCTRYADKKIDRTLLKLD